MLPITSIQEVSKELAKLPIKKIKHELKRIINFKLQNII